MRRGSLVIATLAVLGWISACSSKASNNQNDAGTGGSGGSAAGNGGSATGGTGGGTGGTGGSPGTGGSAGNPGTGGSAGSAGSGGSAGSSGVGWHAIPAPTGQDDATNSGVYCTATTKCVLSTVQNEGDPGAVFAMSDTAVGAKLLDGTYQGALSNVSAELGDLNFYGFSDTASGLAARVSDASVYAVAATGSDITQASSWTFVSMGHDASDGSRVGGDYANIQGSGSNWVLVASGNLYSGTGTPGANAVWTGIWDPTRSPPFPDDFDDQYAADNTLCDGDVTPEGLPYPSDPIFISQDLKVMVSVAGAGIPNGDQQVGVCLSTDQGHHFYYVPLAGIPTSLNNPVPKGVTCTDNDHCFAFDGAELDPGSAYVYYTANASQGKASTWTQATLPSAWTTSDEVTLAAMFFAPDKTHGWIVGNNNHVPLVGRTTDGGKTWTDVSNPVLNLQGAADLYNGFALDANHIWVVGRFGFIAATDTAQK
jgi:hypothetical protein